MGRTRHHSEWECKQCGRCNFLDRATCRLCGKQRQEEDTVIAGESNEPLQVHTAGTKDNACAPDGCDCSRKRRQKRVIAAEQSRGSTRGSPGSGTTTELHRRVRARSAKQTSGTRTPEAKWCKAGLSFRRNETSQSGLGESSREVPGRGGARLGRAGQCSRSGEGASETGAHRVHEGGQRLREQDGGGGTPRGARNAIDSVKKAWPPGAQKPIGLQEAVSVARATLMLTATRTSNSTHEKPKQQGSQAQEDREPEDGRGQQQGLRRRQRWLHDLGRRCDALKGQERRNQQTVRACDDDGRGFRATFLRNTVTACVFASSRKDRGKAIDAQETTKRNVNTLHNWFLPKQQHSDNRSQGSTCIHPEARNSTDTDLMLIDGPTTAEEKHSDKPQTHAEDSHTMPEDDDNPHIKCSTCHAVRNTSMRTMRQNVLRALQTTGYALRMEIRPKRKEEEETRQTRAPLQDKKEDR